MEHLKTFRQSRPGLFLVLACYAVGAAVFLLAHLFSFAQNRVLYATGALSYAQLSVGDFNLVGLAVEPDGSLTTLDADPQMLLKDEARRVESFAVRLEYSRAPRMRTVFWAKPGEDYSVNNMAYSQGGRGEVYYLPAAGGTRFRFDPDTVPVNNIRVQRLEINIKRPFWAFFAASPTELAALVVAPGLAASLLSLAKQAGFWPKRKNAAGSEGAGAA